MKKILAALTIAAMLAIVPSAMAKGTKVPKLLCIGLNNNADTHQLALKSIGTIMDNGSKLKTYVITGRGYYGVIHGSGYVLPGSTQLHATYTGMRGESTRRTNTFELFFDLTTQTGTLYYKYENPSLVEGSDGVTIIDCDMIDISNAMPIGKEEASDPLF